MEINFDGLKEVCNECYDEETGIDLCWYGSEDSLSASRPYCKENICPLNSHNN